MAYRPLGKAIVDPTAPRAFAICSRCGALYNAYAVSWQFQWIGTKLQNKRVQVCEPCMDKPSQFLRQIVLPPDPPAIRQPRDEPYTIDESGGYPPSATPGVAFILGGAPLASGVLGGAS